MNSFISVIMPAYKAETMISDSIKSVLEQTYKNFELIVIDDCSPDQTIKIIEEFMEQDKRIRLIKNEKNQGVAFTRNIGLDFAKGDLVAFLDSDDLWCKEKLEKQVRLLKDNIDVDVTYTEYIRFNSKGLKHKVNIPLGYTDYNLLLKGDFIGNSSALYRFLKFREVRQKKIGAEDYLFWLEIFRKNQTKGLGIQEPLMYYRVSESQASLSGNKFKSASWVWAIYFTHLNIGLFNSLYCFFNYLIKALYKRV